MKKKLIYIVDDSKTILKHAEGVLIGRYDIALFESGKDALRQMLTNPPDLVLLDINMPEMDGYEVFQSMKEHARLKMIPVIFLTADTKQESELHGLEMGAMDYITKPFFPMIMQQRIARILELDDLRKHLEHLVDVKAAEVEKLFIQAITTITYAVDAKDRYTKGHSVRVAQYSLAIAQKLNWSKQDCLNLYYTALLHDIGKIGIPDSILNKPSRLTDEEYRLVRSHTIVGANILHPITMIPQICDGAKYHHERYDGKGYPYGLKGNEIPYIARIIGIADSYDAMTSTRIYEKARVDAYALNEFEKGRGTQFDPYLADVMIEIIREGFTPSDMPEFEFAKDDSEEAEHARFLMEVCKKTERNNRKSGSYDTLTELPIRNTFEETVNAYLEKPLHQGTMFLMDVDDLFLINDNYGHITGDHVICRLADVIRSSATDTKFTCRISGDEFAIFYPEKYQKEWAAQKAEILLQEFREIIADIDLKHQISLSIGVSYTERPQESCKELLQECGKALYYVKINGKNDYKIFKHDVELSVRDHTKGLQIDITHLKRRLTEEEPAVGAYSVDYGNFEKIYQLIARSLRRNRQEAQIILFTLTESMPDSVEISDLNEAMDILEHCIVGSLRKGDVTSRYSSSQQLVIMLDSNIENGHMIAERIISNYSRMYNNYNIELVYNIEQIQQHD